MFDSLVAELFVYFTLIHIKLIILYVCWEARGKHSQCDTEHAFASVLQFF